MCATGESYSRAYPDLLKLHMLQELEDAWALQKASVSQPPLDSFQDTILCVMSTQSACEPHNAAKQDLPDLAQTKLVSAWVSLLTALF